VLPADDAWTLPRLFHWNTEPWLNMEAYAAHGYEMQFKTLVPERGAIHLPAPDASSSLMTLIGQRRSCRDFADKPLPLARLGALLMSAYGVTGALEDPDGYLRYMRAVPSAGALYPIEIYLVTRRVENLADGLYHYQARDHVLEPIDPELPMDQLGELLLGQYYLDSANVAVIVTAVFERTLKKYGPRGYRYVLLEAGHVAQNLCLVAEEAGLGSICTGGFRDTKLNRRIGLDPETEGAVYVVGIGHPIRSERSVRVDLAPIVGGSRALEDRGNQR
jgi:SagB-type dehydrogenase family enzyme